ncbi:hypothetical protein GDO86_001239 [Hymenochirus boettgeri]|uniref:Uncharacterized protein n=1 Tax=Hymenochirus boettgeri TaxID=247094 RepID=A0A8T2KKA4_9PIPI|nr:hypothetical protein GDO86_001239 [Hymenochirus boettgeri]
MGPDPRGLKPEDCSAFIEDPLLLVSLTQHECQKLRTRKIFILLYKKRANFSQIETSMAFTDTEKLFLDLLYSLSWIYCMSWLQFISKLG